MNKSTEKFLQKTLYHYRIWKADVYDADTITVDIDLGFDTVLKRQKIRLARINAYEVTLRGGTTKEEKLLGIEAKHWLDNLLLHAFLNGDPVTIKTSKEKLRGKFGRILGELYVNNKNVNDMLVKMGYAKYQEY